MEIIRLNLTHQTAVAGLNQSTVAGLRDPAFFIPFTAAEIKAVLKEEQGLLLGIMEAGVLTAVSGLLFDLTDFAGEWAELQIRAEDTLEIGGCMTLPAYRGRGCMLALNRELVHIAREKGLKNIIATAHPANIASNKSLQKLGMKQIKQFYRHGYPRNIYLLDLQAGIRYS